MVKGEIIPIGDEILIGQIVDTNSKWIGQTLGEIGLPITRITTVGDRPDQIEQCVLQALERADVVILTGGLGPTRDDRTKEVLARLWNTPLVQDEATYRHIETLTRERGIPFNALNQEQALVPAGCSVLPNPLGTAPGLLLTRGGKLLFALPGVPFEMKALVRDHVVPLLHERLKLEKIVHRTLLTFGVPESLLAERIAPWEEALPAHLRLAYLPNPRGIRLRLSAYGPQADPAEIDAQFTRLEPLIRPYLLGDEPTSVEEALVRLLQARKATLAVAESCTGGSISSRLTLLPGVSSVYLGGVTAYHNRIKSALLGVSPEAIARHGAVSQAVVEQMAAGVRARFGSDYGIATSGIAGPDGGTPEKPVGTVWFAIATPEGVLSRQMRFGTTRTENIERASTHALNMLRLHLIGCDDTLQQTGML